MTDETNEVKDTSAEVKEDTKKVKKKVYKLKTWPKVLVVILILAGFGIYYANIKHQEYLYTQTYEYKFTQIGYSEDEIKILLDKLDDDKLEIILNREYNEFIPMFIQTKYFLFKNLDEYLTQVVTQDQDFFKYKGVDGYNYDDIVALVNVHAEEPFYTKSANTDMDKGMAIITNKYFKLDSKYVPDDLVSIPVTYRYGDEKKIRSEVYEAFVEMFEAAKADGHYLLVESAFRSYDKQVQVYKQYENQKGTKYADGIAARPGFSEHQTGLSLDIFAKECYQQSTFKDSKAYAWLIANSYKYGFILRYPEGKDNLTGYKYESWHYRYIGKDLAKKVHDSGLTYDEYYAYYIEGDN